MKVEFPSEQFIEDYVESKILESGCCPVSDSCVDTVFRQPEIRGYGIADLIKIEYLPKAVEITVLELKNRPLKECDLAQLCKYMRGVERVAEKYSEKFSEFNYRIFGELAGPFNPQDSNFVYLMQRLSDIKVFALEMSLDAGFTSQELGSGWFNHGEDWKAFRKQARAMFNEWPCFLPDLEGF